MGARKKKGYERDSKRIYFQSDGRFFFTNQPNINRILLTKMEAVEYDLLRNEEKNLLAANLKKEHFGIFLCKVKEQREAIESEIKKKRG